MTRGQNERQALRPQASGEDLFAGYRGGEELPLGGYAALLGFYHAAFAAMLLAATQSGRGLPERVGYADLLLMGVATHKLSRIIAKDFVTSPHASSAASSRRSPSRTFSSTPTTRSRRRSEHDRTGHRELTGACWRKESRTHEWRGLHL